jgi:hypothetical protein
MSIVNIAFAIIGGSLVASLQTRAQIRPMPVHMILPHGRLGRGSIQMNQKIIKPMKTAMSGNTDKDYAMMTAEQLGLEIELSKLEIRYGKNRKLKRIARFLAEAQAKQRRRLMAIGSSIEP